MKKVGWVGIGAGERTRCLVTSVKSSNKISNDLLKLTQMQKARSFKVPLNAKTVKAYT